MNAAELESGLADLASVVGGDERPDDEVADGDVMNGVTDLLDDADILVTHRRRAIHIFETAVGPQVGATDAGGGDANDRVCGLDDDGLVDLVDPDVSGGMHDDGAHRLTLQ